MDFDVIIVGAGPAGIFAALELAKYTNLKIAMLERAKRLHDSREVANGFMGGSSRSDVKLFTTPGFGGEINNKYIFPDFIEILEKYGKKKLKISKQHLPQKSIDRINACGVDVDQPDAIVISSNLMGLIEKAMYNYLLKSVDLRANCELFGIYQVDGGYKVETSSGELSAKYIILALGRGGAGWINKYTKNFELASSNTSYDLGIRLEFPYSSFKEYTNDSTNFRLRFGDYRTTAISENGTVELENTYDIKTSNGRTISGKPTGYSNFGFIKTIQDPEPMKKMLNVVQIVNILSDGLLLEEPVSKLLNNTSILCHLPEFVGLKDGLTKLFQVFPNIKSRCSFYAPEARLNALRFQTTPHMESSQTNLYICGDVSGQTKSFVQAGCSGLLAARNIMCKEFEPGI